MRTEILTDVIIPTYQPGQEFHKTLRGLALQVKKINRVIVVNTEEKYWDKSFETDYPGLFVRHIKKSEFNHGKTRYEAAKLSDADILVFMTQDAKPADEHLIDKLIKPIISKEAAISYARQIPYEDCNEIEKITRKENYPDKSRIKTKDDIKELGIKTFLCSNVCAAYDREVYERLGGFPYPLDFNEDMMLAIKAINAGEKISYTADARVYHSHNYNGREQYERNFEIGRNHELHKDIFSKYPSEGAGIKLVKNTAVELLKRRKPLAIINLVWISGCKYLGYRAGKRSVRSKNV